MKLTDRMTIMQLDVSELSDRYLDHIKRVVNIEQEKRIRDADKAKLTKPTVKKQNVRGTDVISGLS